LSEALPNTGDLSPPFSYSTERPDRPLPEFQAMMTEVKADMAAQFAQLREMERSGELAAIPQGEANLH
jgi:hypothetical protein